MKKIWPVLTVLLLLLISQYGYAQEGIPLFIIHGTPDTTTSPPEVRTHLSAINKSTAKVIEGLSADDFTVKEAGTQINNSQVSEEAVGLSIVAVVDRGGISAPGDPRIKQTTDLVRELVNRLTIEEAPSDDIIALVGVGEDGKLQPKQGFSYDPVDTNLVLNALVEMEKETVRGGTPLYEGLDEALRLLTHNTDAAIQSMLEHRRKVIIVFSDGVDPDFSDTAREQDIIRKANEADISIYAVGMARRNRRLSKEAEDNLERLSHQTHGLYQLHNNDETHGEVIDLFDRLMTQRNQYLLTYQTNQPKGDYTLNISVNTEIGTAEESVRFSSVLEAPLISISAPTDGSSYTIPYSQTLNDYESVTIPFRVDITPVDNAERFPSEVRYFVNGVRIGSSNTAPNFEFSLDINEVVTPTAALPTQDFTVAAEAKAPYLGQPIQSEEVNVRVRWEEPPPPTPLEAIKGWVSENWWLLLILVALTIGLVVLLILLIKTRGEVARKVATRTTGVLKGVTKRLSGASQRAPGKLKVIQGANVGKEFRLASQRVKVGRDPQFCDLALYDEYASNPHFSIQMQGTQFYITDEGSTNGTRVNGQPLRPNQRIRLQPDAVIEAGQTRLQFKRLGGTTRQLRGQQQAPQQSPQPAARQAQQGSPRRGGPTKNVSP
jgi:hypothetical protein